MTMELMTRDEQVRAHALAQATELNHANAIARDTTVSGENIILNARKFESYIRGDADGEK